MADILLGVKDTQLTLISPTSIIGTQVNYNSCVFSFNAAWTGFVKTVVFKAGKTIITMLLDENNTCVIPWEQTENAGVLYIGVFGTKDNVEIPTNFVTLRILNGSAGDNAPPPPTIDIYMQVMEQLRLTREYNLLQATIATEQATISTTKAAESENSAIASQLSATNAKTSEDNAKLSEINADISEVNAKTSELNADISEVNAKTSETNAKLSEDAAKLSETNAKISEDNAKLSETNADISETNAKTSEINAKLSEDNAKLSEINAKLSEDNAKLSENATKLSETNAKSSEIVTTQTMQDYLAMIGVDIATLDANGKLSPSQIPPISLIDVLDVVSEDAMLLLTSEQVQRGDVARVVVNGEIGNSYILNGDNPALLENWAQLGDGYVAEAGHALQADTATDSQMINGHRVVTMNQDQYNNAVVEDSTVYLVFPTEV